MLAGAAPSPILLQDHRQTGVFALSLPWNASHRRFGVHFRSLSLDFQAGACRESPARL